MDPTFCIIIFTDSYFIGSIVHFFLKISYYVALDKDGNLSIKQVLRNCNFSHKRQNRSL